MTRRGRLATIPLLSLLLVAASGCSGREGPAGPAGPLHDPPHLSTITPDSGSWRNFVTLRGENFSTDPS
ncbi:MAG TPA: hypothetical protein VMV18_00590, partial [bacterium]|nr:hypothetical protein [bacterium]